MVDEKVILTARQMLQVFSISRQTLSRWTERGCPRIAKGQYPLPEVIEWRDKVLLGNNLDAMKKARLRREEAKAKIEELKAGEEEKRLLDRSIPIRWVTEVILQAKNGFWTLPRRIAEILAPINDAKEIEEILRTEIRKILTDMGEGKKRIRKELA